MNIVSLPDLGGARVLILEDEYYLASDLRDLLTRCGASVIGMFSRREEALEAIDREHPDVALVDVNLGDGQSFDVPIHLRACGIPFLFVTGYDRAAIPTEFSAVPRLEKPVSAVGLCLAAARLIGRA